MAQRDVKLYLSLKKAIKEKVANPTLDFNMLEVDGSLKAYDYDYIFQTARRVFPQKYNLGHSYLHGTPISNLERDDLRALNIEYAQDIVKGWGGTDETQINQKQLDPTLVEYENQLTAPDEHDSVYEDLNQHALPEQPGEENQDSHPGSEGSGDTGESSSGGHGQGPRIHILRRPGLSPEMEAKLNQANKGMQEAKKNLASENPPQLSQSAQDKLSKAQQGLKQAQSQIKGPEENRPQASERMSQRLNSATRMSPTGPLERPSSRVRSARPPIRIPISSQNRREDRDRNRMILPRPIAGGSGLGIPWPAFLRNAIRSLARNAISLGSRAISTLARGALNLGSRALAQLLPRVGMQAGMAAGRGLLFGAAPALVAAAPVLLIYGLIAAIFFIGWLYSRQFDNINCDKPGQMEVKKVLENPRSGVDNVRNGDRIDYQIQVTYIWLCDKITLPSVTVTDTVPLSLEYVKESAKSESPALGPGPAGVYNPANRTITWNLTNVSSNDPYGVFFSVEPRQQDDGSWSLQDTWLQNTATVTYRAPTTRSSGGFTDVTGLLPSPITPAPANWESVKSQIIAAYNKHPELIDTYKQASSETGVPWQVLAGLHFVETGSGPGPDSSLVSGRKIGQVEPDVSPVKCTAGVSGPGKPIPLGGGCGFANQLDSAIYAGHHLAEKIGKVPSTFPEAVEAMSKYNGGGNANCGEGLDYGPCPPQFYGEDDPYAMADFDEPHSSSKMYIIFCADFTRCNPLRTFNRPGAMGVVRALIEEGL